MKKARRRMEVRNSRSKYLTCSLRSDNPAQRVPPRQHNAAMIDLYCVGQSFGKALAFNKRASASGAPVCPRGLGQHSMTLAANSFHTESLSHEGVLATLNPRSLEPSVPAFRTLEVCTL